MSRLQLVEGNFKIRLLQNQPSGHQVLLVLQARATGSRTGTQLQGEREMFYLTTHSTHFIYGYMASDIWLSTILIVRKETCCRHIGYSYRLTARVLLYAPSHRQDNTHHSLCYTSCGALAGTRIAQWVHPMKDRSDDPLHHEHIMVASELTYRKKRG